MSLSLLLRDIQKIQEVVCLGRFQERKREGKERLLGFISNWSRRSVEDKRLRVFDHKPTTSKFKLLNW